MKDGAIIQQLRESRNMSQNQLAKLFFVSPNTITRIENHTKGLSYDEISRLLTILRASFQDFEYLKRSDTHFEFYLNEYYKAYDSEDQKHSTQAFRYFDSTKNDSFENYYYWLKLKKMFSNNPSKIIPKLKNEDISPLVDSLLSSKSYTELDYFFLQDFSPEIYHLGNSKLETLYADMLPVSTDKISAKSLEFSKSITYNLNNAINYYLMEKNYSLTQIYLDYLKTHLSAFPDFDYHCFSITYQKILDYKKTNNPIHGFKIREYSNALKILENKTLADSLMEDLDTFLSDEKKSIDEQNNYFTN